MPMSSVCSGLKPVASMRAFETMQSRLSGSSPTGASR
jgi:hypothetical protein